MLAGKGGTDSLWVLHLHLPSQHPSSRSARSFRGIQERSEQLNNQIEKHLKEINLQNWKEVGGQGRVLQDVVFSRAVLAESVMSQFLAVLVSIYVFIQFFIKSSEAQQNKPMSKLK